MVGRVARPLLRVRHGGVTVFEQVLSEGLIIRVLPGDRISFTGGVRYT